MERLTLLVLNPTNLARPNRAQIKIKISEYTGKSVASDQRKSLNRRL